jgi:hypothetical protein
MMREKFIRKLAYAMWEREGRPDRKDLDHWFRAEALIRDMPAHDGIADLFDAAVARRNARENTAGELGRALLKRSGHTTGEWFKIAFVGAL